MGYLNNSTITVDAILTKKGRELLSKGQSQFNITQFAVADDEVDYTLYLRITGQLLKICPYWKHHQMKHNL